MTQEKPKNKGVISQLNDFANKYKVLAGVFFALVLVVERYITWNTGAANSKEALELAKQQKSRTDSIEIALNQHILNVQNQNNPNTKELTTSNCLEFLLNKEQHNNFVNFMLVNNPKSKDVLCAFCAGK